MIINVKKWSMCTKLFATCVTQGNNARRCALSSRYRRGPSLWSKYTRLSNTKKPSPSSASATTIVKRKICCWMSGAACNLLDPWATNRPQARWLCFNHSLDYPCIFKARFLGVTTTTDICEATCRKPLTSHPCKMFSRMGRRSQPKTS